MRCHVSGRWIEHHQFSCAKLTGQYPPIRVAILLRPMQVIFECEIACDIACETACESAYESACEIACEIVCMQNRTLLRGIEDDCPAVRNVLCPARPTILGDSKSGINSIGPTTRCCCGRKQRRQVAGDARPKDAFQSHGSNSYPDPDTNTVEICPDSGACCTPRSIKL